MGKQGTVLELLASLARSSGLHYADLLERVLEIDSRVPEGLRERVRCALKEYRRACAALVLACEETGRAAERV